jgi:hypothetical protein
MGQFVNDQLNSYWNFDSDPNAATAIPSPGAAPAVAESDESFTGSITTIDNFETGYSSYR